MQLLVAAAVVGLGVAAGVLLGRLALTTVLAALAPLGTRGARGRPGRG